MIYIFIRNKLISCDSILPVALEIHRKTGHKCIFVTWHKPTFDGVQRNSVIYDCINEIGELQFVGNTTSRLFDKINKAIFFVACSLNIILRKTFLIHFGTLNSGKFSLLLKLSRSSRIVMAQTDSSGYSKTIVEVTKREKDFDDSVSNEVAPPKGYLLSFCDKWPWLKDRRVKDLEVFTLEHPRMREPWRNFILSEGPKYTNELALKSKVITIMLGFFGHFGRIRTPESVKECFIETLRTINNMKLENTSIVLKPHTITNIKQVEDIVKIFPDLDIQISFVHPSVLAKVSNVIICNCYSTSVYDGYIQGVPVIEYTDYHELTLEITDGSSSRPEYVTTFINKNSSLLRDAISEHLSNETPKLESTISDVDSSFFQIFN